MTRKNPTLALCLAFLGYIINGLATDEATSGPGRLCQILRDSKVVAVVALEGQDIDADRPRWINLRFRVVKTLQGTTSSRTITLRVFAKESTYEALHEAKQALLFLKEVKDGVSELTDSRGCIRLEGENTSLAEEIQEYLDISRDLNKSGENRGAIREFMIERVATSKSTYFREYMAEGLKGMAAAVPHGFSEEDVAAISKAAMTEKSFLVAAPLCLVLDKLGWGTTDDCILHSVVATSVDATSADATSVELAGLIAKRENLLRRLLVRAEDMRDVKDSGRLLVVLNHLYRVPDLQLLPALRVLAQKNPAAIPYIKAVVGNYADGARHALRRELEEMEKVKDAPR